MCWIDGVPMVDQGRKGYCVVASAERVMRYYGVAVDENELAQLANTSAVEGTSDAAMFDALQNLAQRLRVRVRTLERIDTGQVLDTVRAYNQLAIEGNRAPQLPVPDAMFDIEQIYSAMQPRLLVQARTHNKADMDRFSQTVHDLVDQGTPVLWSVVLGIVPEKRMPRMLAGHMRLIIGYNDQTNEILYTDSWGPGNELKRMPLPGAWTITMELNAIEPL